MVIKPNGSRRFVCDCDCCGVRVDPDDSPLSFSNPVDAANYAEECDWLHLGPYFICDRCLDRIRLGEIIPKLEFKSNGLEITRTVDQQKGKRK